MTVKKMNNLLSLEKRHMTDLDLIKQQREMQGVGTRTTRHATVKGDISKLSLGEKKKSEEAIRFQ